MNPPYKGKVAILQPAKNLNLKDVILSEAKNLFFIIFKRGDPSAYGLSMTRKGKAYENFWNTRTITINIAAKLNLC